MSNCKIFRFAGNLNIVGKLVNESDDAFVLDSPAFMELQMIGPGQLGVALVPYCPFVGNPQEFFNSALIGPPCDADDHTTNSYMKQFHPSAIVVPDEPSLILGN